MAENMNMMDPLKIHAAGVKKPLEQKNDKIQNLYQDQMRYYPTDKKGNLDEWGAVIKRQAEAYNRQMEDNRVQKQLQAQSYGAELQRAMKLK